MASRLINLGENVLTGIDGVGVRVDRLGLLFLRQVLLVLVGGFCPSLGRRAGARLQLDRASAIGSGALGRRRALQPASAPLVDGRRDARHRVQLGVLVDRLQGERVLRVGILRGCGRRWTVAALQSAATMVHLVLDEPHDLAKGVRHPACPALDGVWGCGALRGFRWKITIFHIFQSLFSFFFFVSTPWRPPNVIDNNCNQKNIGSEVGEL